MGLVETEALVLKSFGLSEADKIVVFLTQDKGLVRGVAKGAKRLKSRFGGSLEPFSIVRLSYFQKDERELVSIRDCEIIKTLFVNASNPVIFQKFAYIVDILNEFSPPSDPNERLFRMARVCFETINENLQNLEQIIVYFEIWLLKLGGYLPSWEKCNICKREFNSIEPTNLQTNFHLVCQKCQSNKNGWIISASQRIIYSSAQKYSPIKFLDLTNDKNTDIKELSIVLKKIISSVLGKETVGEKVLITNI